MERPLLSKQPFKAIFILCFLATSSVHVALLAIKYLIRPLRPLPARGWGPSLLSAITKMTFRLLAKTRLQYVLCDDPSLNKDRYLLIEPPAAHVFSGVLAASDSVKPAPLGALWFPSPPPSRQNMDELKKQRVILHFPGGAFVIALGQKKFGSVIADTLMKHLKATRTLWAQYRLCDGSPDSCFPAAIQDALTFYAYVLGLGIDPKNIIVSGDSAGGNVALGLLRHLESVQGQGQQPLPMPGGAIILSPWVNVSAQSGRHYDQCTNSPSDNLCGALLQWGADAYRPREELSSEVEAYVSPLHHPFKLSIPLFIHDGAAEGFHEDIEAFADEMMEMNSGRVEFRSTPLGAHDVILLHQDFGITREFEADLGHAASLLC
ncbi:hypothetical protein MHUMG1_09860 [Metarhizium humberi]|uniref:Alpha/beta hydrolase fold-3 domain-containing protein n=1 Tax=Metarhizium humberi TaxID=2596975 RepID=A0A9P8M3Q7_9HYPO|nr:hypothetical protein MHUMG1_09860 [Metarhizium humberi]